jgi:hypothetical protein
MTADEQAALLAFAVPVAALGLYALRLLRLRARGGL